MYSTNVFKSSIFCLAAIYWKVPTLIWLEATRVKIAPGNKSSLTIFSPVLTTARLLVVGIFKACMASLIIYSLNMGPKTARPSPLLEKDVLPEPLNWISNLVVLLTKCSPNKTALPSPSIVKCPNWWPAYAWAIVVDPFGKVFPENIWDKSFFSILEKSRFKSLANWSFKTTNSGLWTGVGLTSSLKVLDNFEYVLSKCQPMVILIN